ncbi:hypothetical protein TNCV_1192091 [Trichonephila clavipes]|nr:hypothetical protein TNCV_1192091 [Trichonephila clavipes]
MTHTSNERAIETVLFVGMYARVRETQKYGTTKAVTGNQLYLSLPILRLYNYGYFLTRSSDLTPGRGSNPGTGKVDSAFHLFSGLTNECQACLGAEHGGFASE